jgi:hypothetical protein
MREQRLLQYLQTFVLCPRNSDSSSYWYIYLVNTLTIVEPPRTRITIITHLPVYVRLLAFIAFELASWGNRRLMAGVRPCSVFTSLTRLGTNAAGVMTGIAGIHGSHAHLSNPAGTRSAVLFRKSRHLQPMCRATFSVRTG